jgi:hypothetical protein
MMMIVVVVAASTAAVVISYEASKEYKQGEYYDKVKYCAIKGA